MTKLKKVVLMLFATLVAVSLLAACGGDGGGNGGEDNTDGFSPSQAVSILEDAGFVIVTSTKNTANDDNIIHSITAHKGGITNMTTVTIYKSESDVVDPGVDMLGMIFYYKNIQIAGGIPSVNEAALEAFQDAE